MIIAEKKNYQTTATSRVSSTSELADTTPKRARMDWQETFNSSMKAVEKLARSLLLLQRIWQQRARQC